MHAELWNLFQMLSWTYSDPCQLTAPLWFALVLLFPCYAFFVGFPLCHLVATAERLWATVHAKNYENSRPIFGIGAAILVVWVTYMGKGFVDVTKSSLA